MLLATTYILVFALQYSIGLEVPVCVTSLKLLGDLHILIKIPVKLSNPNAEETFFGLTSNDITEASTIANTYKGVELQMNMIRAGYSLKPLGATLLFEEASIYRSRSFVYKWNRERSQPRMFITTKSRLEKLRNESVVMASTTLSPVQDRKPELVQEFGHVIATFSFEGKPRLYQKVTFSYDSMRSEFPKWAYDAITRDFQSNNTDAHPLHGKGFDCHAIEALEFPTFTFHLGKDKVQYELTKVNYFVRNANDELCYFVVRSSFCDDWVIGATFSKTYNTQIWISQNKNKNRLLIAFSSANDRSFF